MYAINMKFFGILIFALWLVSALVLAAENQTSSDDVQSQPLDAERWNRCWWTDCHSNPHCHGNTYKKKTRHCGNHHHKKAYCCHKHWNHHDHHHHRA
ncbi:unnamed protein product [Cunninghamella blakesleeana]